MMCCLYECLYRIISPDATRPQRHLAPGRNSNLVKIWSSGQLCHFLNIVTSQPAHSVSVWEILRAIKRLQSKESLYWETRMHSLVVAQEGNRARSDCLFQKGPIIVQKVQFQSVNVWCLLCYVHIYEQLWSFAFLLDKLKMKKYVLGSLPFLHS